MINSNLTNKKNAPNKNVSKNNKLRERMATVLQVLPSLGSDGGVERGTVEIAQAIVENGGRAIVAATLGPKIHDLDRVGAEHINLPMNSKNPIIIYKNIQRLVKIIETQGVDIIHVRSRAPAWSAYFASKKTGCPLVTTFHGTYKIQGLIKRKYNSIMTSGDKIIAISSFIAVHLRLNYGIPNRKISIIHRGVDLQRFNPKAVSAERIINLSEKWRIPSGLPIVMLPGRLTRWKGQTFFIEAIAKLKRQNLLCLLVGGDQGRSGYRKELEALVVKHKLEQVIRVVDHCNDMPAAYMLADLVVSASIEPEAFGRVIVEAQALGRPVIATDHGGPQETIIQDKTGWLVPPKNIDVLAKTIEIALSLNNEKRTAFFNNGISNIQNNFSKDAMCAKTLDVYNQVLSLKSAN